MTQESNSIYKEDKNSSYRDHVMSYSEGPGKQICVDMCAYLFLFSSLHSKVFNGLIRTKL